MQSRETSTSGPVRLVLEMGQVERKMHSHVAKAREIVPVLSLENVRSGIHELERLFGFPLEGYVQNLGTTMILKHPTFDLRHIRQP